MKEDKKSECFECEMGEAEYVGKFPIRQDITVLPADDKPKKMALGWVYLEGEVVLKDKDGFDGEAEMEDILANGKPQPFHKERLKNFEDIQNGDTVYSTWYGGETVAMKVEEMDVDEVTGKQTAIGRLNDNCYGSLYFNDDLRKCWRCGGFVMISSAINKLSVTEVGEKENG